MIEVYHFPLEGESIGKVKLYVSEKIGKFIQSYDKIGKYDDDVSNEIIAKLDYFARGGFSRTNNPSIEYEGNNVYRIWVLKNIRIIGFYEDGGFIAIDYFEKKQQKLDRMQKAIIEKVSIIKKNAAWKIGD